VNSDQTGIGVYVHIPFCGSICGYCNFNRGLFDAALKARYVDALVLEIERAADGAPADTIFFGGGTPSLLEAGEVARVIDACRHAYRLAPDSEITLETNPETSSVAKLAAFRQAGVNRISFGVQSFHDDELKRLDRAHSAARAADAVREARAAGFTNVSFDLMLWLPGQTMASWMATVDRAIDLAPDHLSLYLLELYPNAPLKEAIARQAHGAFAQVSDDLAADMYLAGLDRLDRAGYSQYEISNVARPDRESRHNLKYWTGGSWRGFGCGAHSTVEGTRWHNVASTTDYIERMQDGRDVAIDTHALSNDARLEEALFTGLRLSVGVDAGNIQRRFGVDPWSRYGAHLQPLVGTGFVWREGARFGLTRPGMLMANEILAIFV